MAEVMKYDDFKEHGSETAVKVRTVHKYHELTSAGKLCLSFDAFVQFSYSFQASPNLPVMCWTYEKNPKSSGFRICVICF